MLVIFIMERFIRNICIIRLDNRFFERKIDKLLRLLRKIFIKVRIEKTSKEYFLLVPYYKNYNKIIRYIIQKQINKILKNKQINQVILDKYLYNIINVKKEELETGKKFYKLSVDRILKYIFNSDEKMSQENIYLFVNEYNMNIVSIIEELKNKFKTVNIITHNLKRFKRIEEKLFEKGYLITVSNNKRKSAIKATYIINYDFKKEEFEKYNINRKAVIINLTDDKNVYGLSFNGVIINDFNVKISANYRKFLDEFYGYLDEKDYFDILINQSRGKKEIIDEIYSEYEVEIVDLLGVRGIISKCEFLA